MGKPAAPVSATPDEMMVGVKLVRNIEPGLGILRQYGPAEKFSPNGHPGPTIVVARLRDVCQAVTALVERDVHFQVIVFESSALLTRGPNLKNECGWYFWEDLDPALTQIPD